MATINHSSGADIIVPSNNGTTYRGLGGDDTYILSNSIAANAAITIVDTSGANKIQLVNGLSVASTKFAADAVQLTLSNGAVVTINGASNFDFDLGGNATAGTSGSVTDFAGFAAGAGVSALPSSGSVAGASNVSVQGTAWSGGTGGSYTVTKSASSVSEGSSVTFTITASSAVSADTTFSWTVIGDSNGSTVDKAGTSDIDVLSGSATIAAGASTTTFNVTASSDSIVEGIEGIKVSVFDASSNALSSDTILVNNTGSAATSQSFTMTAGVNEFVGGSGNDNFDASTTANSLNDFDNIDGGDGIDTVTSKTTTSTDGGESLSPQMSNIEVLSITNTDSDSANGDNDTFTVNLAEATSIIKVMNVTSNDNVTFDNLSNMTALEVKSAALTTTLNYDYLTLAGASDNQEITIKGTNSTTIVLDDDNPLNSSVIETVTINSQAVANTLAALTTTNVNATSLVVNGDKQLTITAALDADIATIDASGSTGGLVLSTAPGAAAVTITGSAGADTITASAGITNLSGGAGNDTLTAAGTWTGTDVFDGGDGIDTLSVSANFVPTNSGPTSGSTILAGLSNVEVIKQIGAGGVVTFDKAIDGVTTVDLTDTGAQVLNLNDGFTGPLTVKLTGDSGDKIINTASIPLTVVANAADINGDNVTTITGGVGTDTLTLTNAADGGETILADPNGTQDRITGVDAITIVDSVSGADVTLTTNDYSNTNAGVPAPLTIDASSLDSGEVFTLTGTASLTAMNVTSGGGDDGLTGGTKSDTIDGGAGNDTLAGTNGNNVLTGGAGNDSITIGDGADNVSGGAGNDTIVGGANIKLTDTIDGGDGTDTLTIGADISSSTIMAGVSNIEVIAPAGGEDITANGSLGGASTFSFANGGNNALTLSAGWTADTTVSIAGDTGSGDSVANSANVNLTVKGNSADFAAATTLTGGTGTDTLLITADGDGTGAVLTNVTNFETYEVVDAVTAGTDVKITPNLTTTKTQTIDGSSLDGSTQNDETLTVDAPTAAGKLVLTGGEGADSLYGGAANDTISGSGGQDSINGNAGVDSLSGGAANDTFLVDSKTEFTGALGSDTIDGGAGVDTVTWTGAMNMTAAQLATVSSTEVWSIAAGSEFTISDAVLTNNPGISFAFAGNGTLSGGEDTAGAALMTEAISFTASAAGDMKLIGSSGDDVYTFDGSSTLTNADTIDGNAGSDTIQLENNTSATDATGNSVTAAIDVDVKGIEKILIVDQAADYNGDVTLTIDSGYTDTTLTIDASSLDVDPTDGSVGEILTLDNNDNVALTVTSGAGRDVIADEGGAGHFSTGAGNDSITSGGGSDTIMAGDGVDTINAGAGTDNIDAGAGNDVINVSTFTDFKTSGGVETVDGGAGTDTLRFDQADTALTLTAPEVSKISNVESIVLDSGTEASSITLGNEAMTSNNGVFNITTNDGSGATTVDASAVSNGVINVTVDNSNASNDILYGGSGDDTFVFGQNGLAATDTINGFGGTDTIILNAADGANVTAVIDFNDVSNIEKVGTKVSATTGLDTHTLTLDIVTHTTTALNAGDLEIDFSGLTATGVGGATFNEDGSPITDSKVNFTIHGSSKADTFTGSAGNDVISAGGILVADSITGGAGNDTLTGASGGDTLKGGTGNDDITGNAGTDSIDGGAGNDVISGGDGIDTIDGEGGADTITLGAGLDILEYNAAADSTGSLKDNITDFTQSTVNATTGDTVTAGDSVNVDFGTLDNTANTFKLADKGDVANAGLAGAAIDGVQGSFIFAVDASTVYLDFNGDGLLNASDLQITFDGLSTFHSNDINAIVTAGTGGDTLTGGNGDDSLTGGSGADSITGGYGADVIVTADGADVVVAGGGADTITDAAGNATIDGGAGNDTIAGGAGADSITGGTGDDTFDLDGIILVANGDTITDFEDEGAVVGDVVEIDASATAKGGTVGDFATMATVSTAAVNDDTAYDLGDTNGTNIIELTVNDGGGDLALSTTGVELEKIVSAGSANFVVDASEKFYILAYDGGKAYLYYADSGANTDLTAAEILLIAVFDGITAGGFVAEDFILG